MPHASLVAGALPPAMLSAAAGARHSAYVVLVALHVAAAFAGFGAVALSGFYGASARRLDRPGVADEARRYFRRPVGLETALLVVPFLGAAALAIQPGGHGVVQAWSMGALGLWLLAAIVFVRVVRPMEDRLSRLLGAGAANPGDTGRAAEAAASRLAWAAGFCDIVFVVALVLMVWKPR